MSTPTNIAWYYVGVMALLLVGQNYVLNTAHKEQMAKLSAKLAGPAPAAAAAATPASAGATPAQAPAPAEPSKTVVAPPASTLNPTPAATTVPAHQATMAAAKAAPATDAKPSNKSEQPLKASPAPAVVSSGKSVPVEFGFRSEPFEKSKIVTLTNRSGNKLDCMVTVKRPGTGESQSFKVVVPGAAEVRLAGSEQGWKFKTGDRIEVAQAGFKSKSTSVP